MNIVELAKEAGLQLNVYAESYPVIAHQLEKFYELAFAAGAAHEREACAKVVETTHAQGLQSIREACAAAIRART